MVESAYQVLGLERGCSNADIKKAFRQLAKATHPDLQNDASKETTARFIRILAAYQILSDPQKRAVYDSELSSFRATTSSSYTATSYRRRSAGNWESFRCEFTYEDIADDSEVVEWLRKYRARVTRIVHQRHLELGNGTSFFDSYRADIFTTLRNIYFGPDFRALRGFPDAFEAEERSTTVVSDILQLVYGRFLFATVSLPRDELRNFPREKDQQQQSPEGSNLWSMVDTAAYSRLELRINGKVEAYALRQPLHTSEIRDESFVVDSISVYSDSGGTGELLGRIQGLAAMDAGTQGIVFDRDGIVTHTLFQYRTPMVKHLHWYRVGGQKMHCDCRCRRAWLLPSRFWLFQPRSRTHNIGGWYIETFQHKRKIPSSSKLNPAMYILAAAYKTLDGESAKKRKSSASFMASAMGLWKLINRSVR